MRWGGETVDRFLDTSLFVVKNLEQKRGGVQ